MLRLAPAVLLLALAATGCDDGTGTGGNGASAPVVRTAAREKRASGKADGKHEHDKHGSGKAKFKLGRIDYKAITESSGLAASRQHPGVFWTHNDSGNGPFIFAITREGHFLGEYPVSAVKNTDWEAISIDDEGHLYIGDLGNNVHHRDRVMVYRVDEPDPATVGPKSRGAALAVNKIWRLKHPDKPFDAESLVIWQGKGYVISKLLTGENAGLYRFDLSADDPDGITLEHVGDLPIRSPVTDAAISTDGKQLAVMSVTGPNLFQIDGDVTNACKTQPAHVTYFDPGDMNMEGICFVEEGLLASTEQGQMLLFDYKYFADEGGKAAR